MASTQRNFRALAARLDKRRPRKPIKVESVPSVEAVLSAEAARKAGLRYVTSKGAGLTRVPFRQSFKYLDAHGQRITDAETLGRIRKLVIPPAWRNVWISASEDAHLQATGIDARGRKQYRYHADYRAIRDSVKFDKLLKFGKALPRIHAAVEADLKLEGLQKRKLTAAVVRLLKATSLHAHLARRGKRNVEEKLLLRLLDNEHSTSSSRRTT